MRKVEEEWNTSEWQGRTRKQVESSFKSILWMFIIWIILGGLSVLITLLWLNQYTNRLIGT